MNTYAAKAYTSVALESSVQGADPLQLIIMLYQGALQAIANAKGSIQKNDIPAKNKAITHAIRIIGEGLRESLNKKTDGQVAENLDALYAYMCVRLVNANVNNDIEMLDEVARLLSELKGAWETIHNSKTTAARPMSVQPPPGAMSKPEPLVYGRR